MTNRRGNISVVIVVPLVLLVGGISAWAILSSIYSTITQPRAQITSEQFAAGTCVPEYWIWKTGEHLVVTATFNLTNTGQSDGMVNIDFKSDGTVAATHDFFIGAGQTQTMTYQFQAEGCVAHSYHAEISSVSRISS